MALKGGPSEGFGLTASAPGQAGPARAAGEEENPTDPNSLGNLASADMGMTGIITGNRTHNNHISNSLHSSKMSDIGDNAPPALNPVTAKAVAARGVASKGLPVGSIEPGKLTGKSTGDEDMDAPAQENVSPTRNVPAENAAPENANPVESAAPATVETLESPLALDADFLDLAPVPDAVAIQPTMSPFALSQQATAYANFITDSVRNSLMDPHGIQFGGVAGLNWSGATATNTTGKVSGTPLSGFTLGAFADIPLRKNLSFRPELLYSYEGYQPQIGGDKVNIHVAYLNVPLDFVYHTNFLNKRFFIGAGPYLAYAFNGTYTMKGSNADGTNTDMRFGNNYAAGDNLKSTDFGANFMAGILLNRNFVLGASINLGLSNIAPSGAGSDIHTRSIGLSIGYVFRNKANTKTN
jgi:hypothetical protein